MDNLIADKIAHCEKAYNRAKNSKTGFLLAQRYWLSYKISGQQSYLTKALDVASVVSELDFCSLPLYFACVFLNMEMGYFDVANKLITELKPQRNYFKNNDPESFAMYLYCVTLIELNKKKNRAATRFYEALEDYNAEKNIKFKDFLLSSLNISFLDYNEAYKFLELAYKRGTRSAGFYASLYEYYEKADINSGLGESLILQFINWAISHGLDLSPILSKWQEMIMRRLQYNPKIGEKIYKIYPYDWVLKIVCNHFISNYETSENAFYFYKEAETKQLMFPKLNDFLVESAHENGIENISRYSLEQYINNNKMDTEMAEFVYHLLLTDAKYSDLAEKNEDKIIMFGIYCLENAFSGHYFYSIFKFLISMAGDGRVNEPELIKNAEKIIQSVLFTYDIAISAPKIKHILIFEKDKKQASAYDVVDGKVKITACDDEFTYQCFGENMRHMINTEQGQISITRLVKNADIKLYEHFFKRKCYQTELLVNLTRYYMTMEIMPFQGELALEKAIEDTSVSVGFKMRAAAALGNYYAFQNQYEKAVEYYIGVDENFLDERNIEHMLLILIHTKKYEKAVNIITKNSECITDRSLFFALKQIANLGVYDKLIADTAYELTLKSWYDKSLIDIVLKHYSGSQEEWQELSGALSKMSLQERGLDEIILENAIWIHRMDRSTQEVFVRMFELNRENPLINDFALYLVYEIIVNSLKPEEESIECLEELYLKSGDHFLGYGLCHYYINNDTMTSNADKILSGCMDFCQEDGFIFPIFKRVKDKKMLTSYIEKNMPFIYRGFPDKKVDLFYKLDDEAEFIRKGMRYVRFGLYFAHVTHFYGETIKYYFSEQISSGSTLTKIEKAENNNDRLEENEQDTYYAINNALIYEQMFKYDKVEEIITRQLEEAPRIKGRII